MLHPSSLQPLHLGRHLRVLRIVFHRGVDRCISLSDLLPFPTAPPLSPSCNALCRCLASSIPMHFSPNRSSLSHLCTFYFLSEDVYCDPIAQSVVIDFCVFVCVLFIISTSFVLLLPLARLSKHKKSKLILPPLPQKSPSCLLPPSAQPVTGNGPLYYFLSHDFIPALVTLFHKHISMGVFCLK